MGDGQCKAGAMESGQGSDGRGESWLRAGGRGLLAGVVGIRRERMAIMNGAHVFTTCSFDNSRQTEKARGSRDMGHIRILV